MTDSDPDRTGEGHFHFSGGNLLLLGELRLVVDYFQIRIYFFGLTVVARLEDRLDLETYYKKKVPVYTQCCMEIKKKRDTENSMTIYGKKGALS